MAVQAMKDVENGNISRVYLLVGTETYLIETFIDTVIKQMVGTASDPNVITYSLQDVLLQDVVEDANTISFIGGNKVIVCKDFLLVSSAKLENNDDHEEKSLTSYVTNPAPQSTVILVCPTERLDGRKTLTKQMRKWATVVECQPLSERKMNEWVANEAKKRGFTFTQKARTHFIKRVGPNLMLLANELDKIALHGKNDGAVDVKTVQLLVPRSLEDNVFTLTDYAVQNRLDESLFIYHDLLKQGIHPVQMLALLARQVRIFYQVKELMGQSYSQRQMAEKLQLHPYVVKLAMDRVRRFSSETLLHLLGEAAQTDYAIKSGKMEGNLAVELFIMKVSQQLVRT